MTAEQRDAIRAIGAADARRWRVSHGLPERIEDPTAVAALAALLRALPESSHSKADEHVQQLHAAA